MVPKAGARDRMVQSVVINFSSKVYSKSLLKGLHEANPADLYVDAG